MKFQVFHANNPNFGFGEQIPFNSQNFTKVAEVEVTNIDEVFRVTNHINKRWWKNPEVLWHKHQSRSTSVGDVVIDENGKHFRCEMVDWSFFEDKK